MSGTIECRKCEEKKPPEEFQKRRRICDSCVSDGRNGVRLSAEMKAFGRNREPMTTQEALDTLPMDYSNPLLTQQFDRIRRGL